MNCDGGRFVISDAVFFSEGRLVIKPLAAEVV